MSACDDTSREASCDVAATADELARLEAALLTLPRLTREVFLAHRIDDLGYAEIAAWTGLSVRRIEREIARALCGLDRAMRGQAARPKWWKLTCAPGM